jgi:hypothetical protein
MPKLVARYKDLEDAVIRWRIIPDVAEDRHVVIMLRCEHHVPEHVHCSNTAVRTTNVLIYRHLYFLNVLLTVHHSILVGCYQDWNGTPIHSNPGAVNGHNTHALYQVPFV